MYCGDNAKNNIINNGNGQRFKPINLIFDVSGKSDVYDKLRKSLIAQQNATLDYVISEVNVGLEKPPVGEDYISEFSARINAMKKRIQPFSNNHGAYVNSNVNNQEKIRDIYKKYRDLIKRFVTYRASQLTVMEIDSNSAVMKRHRLTDERAYANNFYDIDSGTGILMRDSNVPIVKRKGHCIGFLHKSSCWIVIDTMVVSIEENKKSLASVRVVPYGEF